MRIVSFSLMVLALKSFEWNRVWGIRDGICGKDGTVESKAGEALKLSTA